MSPNPFEAKPAPASTGGLPSSSGYLPATVTAVHPAVTVTVDGSVTAVPAAVGLYGGVNASDRVWVARVGTVVTIVALQASGGPAPAFFFGSITTSTAITANSNMPFVVVEDLYGGWNASTHLWTVPVAGLYLACGQIKSTASIANNGIDIFHAVPPASATRYSLSPAFYPAAFSGGNHQVVVRCAAGDTLAMQAIVAYTTQSDTPSHNNFLQIVQLSR